MPKADEITRRAVLDLGSNSFRLVVFESTSTWWRRSDEIREPVRLAGDVNEDGSLNKKAVARALDVLDVFAGFLRAAEIDPSHVHAIGTSAIREATNQAEIIRLAKDQCGIDIDMGAAQQLFPMMPADVAQAVGVADLHRQDQLVLA